MIIHLVDRDSGDNVEVVNVGEHMPDMGSTIVGVKHCYYVSSKPIYYCGHLGGVHLQGWPDSIFEKIYLKVIIVSNDLLGINELRG